MGVSLSFKKYVLITFLIMISSSPSLANGQNLLCRPWQNVLTGIAIGESFTAKIDNGLISFFGEHRPTAFGQLIYSHPLNDIFIAASGELVAAGYEGTSVRVNVYYPNQDVKFFVTTSCVKT